MWSVGLMGVFSVWGAVGVVTGSSECVQCVGGSVCGHWV